MIFSIVFLVAMTSLLGTCITRPLSYEIYKILVVLPYSNQTSCKSLSPWIKGEDIQPAMELARDQINSQIQLLHNSSLELFFIQDGCKEVSETIYNFVESYFSLYQSRVIGLIGPSTSLSANTILSIINRKPMNLVILEIIQRDSFQSDPTFLTSLQRSVFSSQTLVRALTHLINLAQWTNVSLLIDGNNEFYTRLGSELLRKSQSSSIHVKVFRRLPVSTLRNLASNNTFNKAVIVFAPATVFKKIVCLPDSRKLEHHQWVYVGSSGFAFTESMHFSYNGRNLSCTEEFYHSALDKSLVIIPSHNTRSNRLDPMNITTREYLHHYAEYRKKYNAASPHGTSSIYSEFSRFFYDCVWAWAMVLEELSPITSVSEYSIEAHRQELRLKLAAVRFVGASGIFNHSNSNSSDYINKAALMQFCNGELRSRHFASTNEMGCNLAHARTFLLSLNRVDYFLSIIASFQALVLIILQILTIVYRNEPTIKAADRTFLHISYIGAYILHIVTVVDMSAKRYANFKFLNLVMEIITIVWLMPVGVTFLISSIIARSWRVYRIFIHTFHPGKCLASRWFPVILIAIFCGIDLILAATTTILIFYVHYGPNFQISVSVLIFSLFGVMIVIKIGTFVILCILTFLTETVEKPLYSTRPYYFVLVLNILLLAIIFCNIFVFKMEFHVLMVVFSEILIYIFFVFLPPLFPVLKRPCGERFKKKNKHPHSSQNDIQVMFSTDTPSMTQ